MGPLLKYLYNFLSGCNFKVKYQGNYSELKNIEYGLPQGAILTLCICLHHCATMYANDLVLWQNDSDVTKALNKLQIKLNTVIKWSKNF